MSLRPYFGSNAPCRLGCTGPRLFLSQVINAIGFLVFFTCSSVLFVSAGFMIPQGGWPLFSHFVFLNPMFALLSFLFPFTLFCFPFPAPISPVPPLASLSHDLTLAPWLRSPVTYLARCVFFYFGFWELALVPRGSLVRHRFVLFSPHSFAGL